MLEHGEKDVEPEALALDLPVFLLSNSHIQYGDKLWFVKERIEHGYEQPKGILSLNSCVFTSKGANLIGLGIQLVLRPCCLSLQAFLDHVTGNRRGGQNTL